MRHCHSRHSRFDWLLFHSLGFYMYSILFFSSFHKLHHFRGRRFLLLLLLYKIEKKKENKILCSSCWECNRHACAFHFIHILFFCHHFGRPLAWIHVHFISFISHLNHSPFLFLYYKREKNKIKHKMDSIKKQRFIDLHN